MRQQNIGTLLNQVINYQVLRINKSFANVFPHRIRPGKELIQKSIEFLFSLDFLVKIGVLYLGNGPNWLNYYNKLNYFIISYDKIFNDCLDYYITRCTNDSWRWKTIGRNRKLRAFNGEIFQFAYTSKFCSLK